MILDEDQSISLSAYVTSPGYQSVVVRGYITQQRGDGLYAAPLIPQLFYGADGKQLQTWRQYLPQAGSQVILSRSGGQPKVPRNELGWRKVSQPQTAQPQQTPTINIQQPSPSIILVGLGLLAIIAVLIAVKT